MPKKAFWNEKEKAVEVECPHCLTRNVVDDIPGDEFEDYKCFKCKKIFYIKTRLAYIVRATK